MEKVCGYKSKSGKFFTKKKECELSNIKFEIRLLKETLINFKDNIEHDIFISNMAEDLHREWSIRKDTLLNIVCENILKDSSKFIEIINEKKNLEDQLTILQKQDKIKTWWLKTKWW